LPLILAAPDPRITWAPEKIKNIRPPIIIIIIIQGEADPPDRLPAGAASRAPGSHTPRRSATRPQRLQRKQRFFSQTISILNPYDPILTKFNLPRAHAMN